MAYFAKLASFEEEHCKKGELYMEYRKMSCQEKNCELCEYCRATNLVSPSYAHLHNPIPITANFLTFTTYQVRKHKRLAANLMIVGLELK